MPNTHLITLEARLRRDEHRLARARARQQTQLKALEHLLKMNTPIHKLFAPAPWSLKKPKGFRLSVKSRYSPHQGERECARRVRQMSPRWI
jgi:hypothetical protein